MKSLLWLSALWLLLLLAGRAHPLEFRSREKGGVFPNEVREELGATLKKYPNGRLARAYRGERPSLHRYFVRAQTVFEDDDDNPAMSYLLLKLLFGCRDTRYSRALETEDFATRQAVGRLLNPLLVENHLSYPLTRATYHYRPRPRSRAASPRD
ncbi:MAG: hypothetical protein K8R23_00135 [Chthoniobacter sp.]|nr:hypothetical protein [Chthoniobacter sp.]